jgi:hypothetical protein
MHPGVIEYDESTCDGHGALGEMSDNPNTLKGSRKGKGFRAQKSFRGFPSPSKASIDRDIDRDLSALDRCHPAPGHSNDAGPIAEASGGDAEKVPHQVEAGGKVGRVPSKTTWPLLRPQLVGLGDAELCRAADAGAGQFVTEQQHLDGCIQT